MHLAVTGGTALQPQAETNPVSVQTRGDERPVQAISIRVRTSLPPSLEMSALFLSTDP